MSPAAAQLQFAAEFLGFLAAIAGVALALLRAAPRRPPPGVAVAFAVLAIVAFVAGSRIVEDSAGPFVALPRLVGAALLAIFVVLWDVEGRTKVLLLTGALATALAVPLVVIDQAIGSSTAVAIGGLLIGGAVLDLARRSVASRIAVSGAASLLVIVLVLSVALSAAVDNNLRDEAVKRLNERAKSAADAPAQNLTVLVRIATLAKDRLAVAAAANQDLSVDRGRAAIEDALARLEAPSFAGESYLYLAAGNPAASPVSPSETVLGDAAKRELGAARIVNLIGSQVVADARCPATPGTGVVILDGQAYGVVASPVCAAPAILLGRLLVLSTLDERSLGEATDSASTSLAFHEANRLVAQSGPQPDPAVARVLTGLVLSDSEPHSATVGDRFVSAAPVIIRKNEPPPLVLVASSPTAGISDTRNGLFQALFGIALLGTLVALLLAAVVGERIGARLRSLTQAAESLGRGDPGVRTGLTGDDEVGALGITFDAMASSIEEKTEAEGRLRERLEAVVGEMGEALVATDAQARITDFNRSAEDLIGVSAGTALGRQVDQVVSLTADDGADLASRLKQPPRTPWSTGATLSPLEGTPVPVAVSGAPLRSPTGGPAGGVFVLRDLRGEREVERMKTEFLSRIGHELRTPLTGVLGYSEMLLRRSWPADRARQMLEEVNSSGHRLERIVQLLEFFAAAAAGRTLLRLEPVEVRGVADDVLKLWEQRVKAPLTLTRKVARGLPSVMGDPRWLRLALSELVDNAIKFSPVGGAIVISAVRTGDGRIDLAVTDHGVGMTASDVERAFTDFEQGDTSDTRRYGGLGLGLPFVLRVVEGHGGEVRCATTPGRGTRISLLLPPR